MGVVRTKDVKVGNGATRYHVILRSAQSGKMKQPIRNQPNKGARHTSWTAVTASQCRSVAPHHVNETIFNHQSISMSLSHSIHVESMHTSTDARRGRRRRRRSASPARLEQERQYYNHLSEEYDAEEKRRSRLPLEEKMAENGHELQRRLEQDPEIRMLLQPSPPGLMGKAQCRARDCLFEDRSLRQETRIMDDYRIALVSHAREYFHVSCLEQMLDLSSLAPTRFMLDKESYRWNDGWPWTWGLMLRLWFEHGGRIDLAKVKAYLKSYKEFEKADGEFSTEYIGWQLKHQRECSADARTCRCPPEPKGPIPPTLEDYKSTTGEPCCLSEVLDHPYVERHRQNILVNPPSSLYNHRATGSTPPALN